MNVLVLITILVIALIFLRYIYGKFFLDITKPEELSNSNTIENLNKTKKRDRVVFDGPLSVGDIWIKNISYYSGKFNLDFWIISEVEDSPTKTYQNIISQDGQKQIRSIHEEFIEDDSIENISFYLQDYNDKYELYCLFVETTRYDSLEYSFLVFEESQEVKVVEVPFTDSLNDAIWLFKNSIMNDDCCSEKNS